MAPSPKIEASSQNDSFLEAFRDGRRSGGRQPALRRPGALRRRTTGSPTVDSFVSHVQYLMRNQAFFHGSESECSIAPATDVQDRRQNINTVHIFHFSARIRLRGALLKDRDCLVEE